MNIRALVTPSVLVMAASCASASITFSFADPAPGKQMLNTANGTSPGVGLVTYDQTINGKFTFIVGSDDGSIPTTLFPNARMDMEVALAQANAFGGFYTAPISGAFTIYTLDVTNTIRTDILTGTFVRNPDAPPPGILFGAGASASMITNSDPPDDLIYTAGPALTAILPLGTNIAPRFDAVFTLTDITTLNGGPIINPGNGVVNSFLANASYSGTAQLVPTPGSIALLGLAGLFARRRQR